MQCRRCCGRGKEWYDDENYGPCSECKGFGIVHCCEGEIAQSGPDLEPPLKGGKVIREVFIFVKDSPKTGYEMTYHEVAPSPIVAEIAQIILEGFRA